MREGDAEIAQLYRRLGPVVYRRCLRLLLDREAAQDATQEVFLKLLAHPEKLSDPEAAVAWIFEVSTNYCLNQRRDATRRSLRLALQTPGHTLEAPQDALASRQLARQVLSAHDSQTQAIALEVFVGDRERLEVAEQLGISRKTVTRKLASFLAEARRRLAGVDR
jgi:RNA polymerase sigma-70 factor (ECF subfamily)